MIRSRVPIEGPTARLLSAHVFRDPVLNVNDPGILDRQPLHDQEPDPVGRTS
jgi:hypothetical protein